MQNDIQHGNAENSNGLGAGPTSPGPVLVDSCGVQRHRRRKIRVEVEVPEALMGEFDLAVQEVLAGSRTRLTLLEQEIEAIEVRGLTGLGIILGSIADHPGTSQTRRLVRFLVGLYDGSCFPFDLSDLRGLDTVLANACLDYLNYDRVASAISINTCRRANGIWRRGSSSTGGYRSGSNPSVHCRRAVAESLRGRGCHVRRGAARATHAPGVYGCAGTGASRTPVPAPGAVVWVARVGARAQPRRARALDRDAHRCGSAGY